MTYEMDKSQNTLLTLIRYVLRKKRKSLAKYNATELVSTVTMS